MRCCSSACLSLFPQRSSPAWGSARTADTSSVSQETGKPFWCKETGELYWSLATAELYYCVCSCVFVWKLDSQMTATMRKRRGLGLKGAPETCARKQPNIRCVKDQFIRFMWRLVCVSQTEPGSCYFRRETFITVPSSQLHQMEEEVEEGDDVDTRTPGRLALAHGEEEEFMSFSFLSKIHIATLRFEISDKQQISDWVWTTEQWLKLITDF